MESRNKVKIKWIKLGTFRCAEKLNAASPCLVLTLRTKSKPAPNAFQKLYLENKGLVD